MEANFKPGDETLRELVAARRDEVVRLQAAQADQLKDMETRGQARLAELRKSLPKDLATVLDNLDRSHEHASAVTQARVDTAKARLAASRPAPENETAGHPGLAGGHLVAPT